MRISPIYLLVLVAVGSFACRNVSINYMRNPILSYNGEVLYEDMVVSELPKYLTPEDSLLQAEQYTNQWLERKLLLDQAHRNLSNSKQIEQMVAQYREQLMLQDYQNQLIREQYKEQKVTDQALAYYQEHKHTFILQEPICKGVYIKLPLNAPALSSFKRWIAASDPTLLEKIEKYSLNNMITYENYTEQWKPFSQLIIQVPQSIDDPQRFLESNRYIAAEDEAYCYMFWIGQYVEKGALAPFDYVKGTIEETIAMASKREILDRLLSELKEYAIRKKDLVWYNGSGDPKK